MTADLYATATGLVERSASAYAAGVPEGARDNGFFGPYPTAGWRAISEEIWPFVRGPAATPMGEAEAAWLARRHAAAA